MDLDELLQTMDRASANLAKLDAVWNRAKPMIPTGPSRGTNNEYENRRREWTSLLRGLPPLHGWKVTAELPDIDAAGQAFFDYAEIGEPPFNLVNELEEPGQQLDEYRFRLAQARREAVRDRLRKLTATIQDLLPKILEGVPRDSQEPVEDEKAVEVNESITEIERLLGDTTQRRGRWGDLHRHLHFGEGHDWHDISEMDWPSVKDDIEAATLSEADPIPIPEIDLGVAASGNPQGGATTGLNWASLDDDSFERLLFDLMRGFPSYKNVEWLQKTRATDRGRDLSVDRVITDDGGTTRFERTIIQAKHWQSKSVGPSEVTGTLGALPLWQPPVRVLVIATSGRFTSDAVAVAEKHNAEARLPFIELWPDNRLETLLSQRPDLLGGYGLRP